MATEPFRQLLDGHLTRLGMSRLAFATAVGTSSGNLTNIFKGRRRPPLTQLRKWADVLGLNDNDKREFLEAAASEHSPDLASDLDQVRARVDAERTLLASWGDSTDARLAHLAAADAGLLAEARALVAQAQLGDDQGVADLVMVLVAAHGRIVERLSLQAKADQQALATLARRMAAERITSYDAQPLDQSPAGPASGSGITAG